MNKKYPEELYEFIRQNFNGMTNRELAELVNAKFGTDFNYDRMHNFICNNKLKRTEFASHKKNDTKRYPKEVRQFLKDNVKGTSFHDLTKIVNDKFGTYYTYEQLRGTCKRLGYSNGCDTRFKKGIKYFEPKKGVHYSPRTEWKKGHITHNKKPVGSIVFSDRYLRIKVAEPDKWEFYHRYVWEQNNGPVPEGMLVIFLDKNPMNCSIENLTLVSMAENATIKKYHVKDTELRKTAINIARLTIRTKELEKGSNNHGKSSDQGEKTVQAAKNGPLSEK